jgi:flagellar FliJ protein
VTRPFQFRLERVRALRQRVEDSAKEEFAASLSHRLKGEAMLRAASEQLDRARRECRPDNGTTATGPQLQALQAYLERVERARSAAAEDLSRREQEVRRRRERLVEAARERQALDRLRERREADYLLDASRSESAALDEMAIAMQHRREGLR